MNELAALNTHPTIKPAFTPGSTGGDLIREAAALWGTAYQLARAICSTSIVPVHFRGKPEECAAAMVYGASLGLDPIASLRGLYNVHGSVAMYAQLAVSIVLRDQHDVWVVESTDQAVTVAGRRNGWPEDRTFTATWTYDRARKAGYTGNKKYDTDPIAMLTAKAQMEVCRRIAPDSLAGIYSVEELELEPGVRSGVKGDASQRAVSAATFTSVTPKPEPSPAPAEEPPADEPLTDTQRGTLTSLFDEAGIPAENQRAYIADRLDRDDNRRKLTVAEADAVIAHLRRDMAQEAEYAGNDEGQP